MKRKFTLLHVCMTLVLWVGSLQGASATNPGDDAIRIILQENGNDKPRDVSGGETTQPGHQSGTRRVDFEPIYAYLDGQRIMLDFVRTFPWVTVTVTSETTGETIYQSTDSYPTTLFIDLNGASRGDYRIDIVVEDASWEGYFLL